MKNGKSRAAQFLNRNETFETSEVTLPSGCVVLLRRPPLRAWAIAGTLPPFFVGEVREAWLRATEPTLPVITDPSQLPMERGSFALKVVRALARWAFVDPKLEDGADGSDESIDPSFLTEDDWAFLSTWLLKGSPDIPVETSGEAEVQIDDLLRFREGA